MRLDPDPGSALWGSPPLPAWVESFRPDQLTATSQIESLFGGGVSFVFLDAPTGSGKTLIAEMVRRRLNAKSIYLCTTKTLQKQFTHDFPNGVLIQGRSNYPTFDDEGFTAFNATGQRHLDASYCTKERTAYPGCDTCNRADPDLLMDEHEDPLHCMWCHPWQDCPYETAKKRALDARLAVANTSYFLTEGNTVGKFGNGRFQFVIIDEADSLEDEIMRHVELSIGPKMIKRLHIPEPERKTVPDTWPTWAALTVEVLRREERRLGGILADRRSLSPRQLARWKREKGSVTHLRQRLELVGPHLADEWVYTGYDRGRIQFRPIKVDKIATDILWRHGVRFLLMSATIISASQMAQDLGMPDGSWGSVQVGSGFPIANRPIFVKSVANMTRKTKDTEWPKMADAIRDIMFRHPSDRILVHTVSYALTSYLASRLDPSRVVLYESSLQRDTVLAQFRATPAAVLLAPSFVRGVDLPDDDCRVIVVAKVMFPSLGDRQVSARLHSVGGQSWYSMQTVRSIVQSTGRGMRHQDDRVTTYILDTQFASNVWRRSRGMVPRWWADALVWEAPTR